MKKITGTILALCITGSLLAQKVDYKANVISVDGKDVAMVTKIKDKENFGLTSTYELNSLTGKKLVIATIATDFVPPRYDNSGYYYRLTFLTSGQVGIFTLSKLGPEKSFAKLIGESGIVVNDQLDESKVNEFIALKSKNPRVSVSYDLVHRNRMMPVFIKETQVYQGDVIIGQFKDVSSSTAFDTYEFSLPTALTVAKVSFNGGNSAKNCTMTTYKDQQTQNVNLARNGTFGNTILRSEGVDRNEEILKLIAKWLVEKDYL